MSKEIPEGFTPWSGGACPVAKDSKVQIKVRDGTLSERKAEMFTWSHIGDYGDIIAYRVIEEEKPAVKIPEGFTPWSGGDCPVDPDAGVDVIMSDGSVAGSEASDFDWHHVEGRIGNIIAYRADKAEKPAVEIPEGFTPWAGGECPVNPGVRVQVVFRNGEIYKFSESPLELEWAESGYDADIIAYRVIGSEQTQRANDIQVGGNHYKDAGIQPWEVVDTWPLDQRIGFYRGNALKYTMRMGTKDEQLTEIKKAAHYLQKLVEVLEEQKGCA